MGLYNNMTDIESVNEKLMEIQGLIDRADSIFSSELGGVEARGIMRSSGIADRVIKSPVSDAIKEGYKVTTDTDPEIDEMIIDRFAELKLDTALLKYGRDVRLYSRGGVFFPILRENGMRADKKHLRDPLLFRNIIEVESFNVIAEEHRNLYFQSDDGTARNYEDLIYMDMNVGKIHLSRFKYKILKFDSSRQRGVSVLEKALPSIKELDVAICSSLASLPGVATDLLWEYLSRSTGIPQSIIKGSASSERDLLSYYGLIKSEIQIPILQDAIAFAAKLVCSERSKEIYGKLRSLGFDPQDIKYNVEFNPIKTLTTTQSEDNFLKDSQRGSIDVMNGVRSASEVRKELYPDLK